MLTEGTEVGGRFRVEDHNASEFDGHVYNAIDLRTTRTVALWVLPSDELSDPLVFQELRASVKAAMSLDHRNIVPCFGIGQESDGAIYIAHERVEGITLTELVLSKSARGRSFSPRGAYNVLTHVVNALSFARSKLAHGVLSADSIIVDVKGRVMVSNFGMAPLLCRHQGFVQSRISRFIAPEILRGEVPTQRADVFSLGAVLSFMVSGTSFASELEVEPSRSQPLLPEELDRFVELCLSTSSGSRPHGSQEFRSRLLGVVETFGAPKLAPGEEWPFDDELAMNAPLLSPSGMTARPQGDSEEISLSKGPAPPSEENVVASSPPPKEPTYHVSASSGGTSSLTGSSSTQSKKTVGGHDMGFDLAPPPPPGGEESSSEMIDLGNLISEVTQSENQMWMVHKDQFDHGPFSARELAQQIFSGQINDDDIVLNMETGQRQRCALWPEFSEVLEKARVKRRQEEEEKAAQRVESVEKKVGVMTYVIVAGIILLLGGGVATYFIYRGATRGQTEAGEQLADLVEGGNVTINTGGGILPLEEEQTKRRRRRSGRRGSGGRGGMSAEEAMSQGADFGDLSGPTTQLSVSQINSIMNRNARRFYPCLAGHTGRVNLDFVINGDGSVAGVSVPGASGSMRSCMASKMRSIRFPSFNAPRMRATFFFEVGR